MTYNEIIKALECCNGWDGRCLNCPLNREGTNCKEKLNSYTLNLINGQREEIKRLEKKANTPFAKVTFDENKLKEIVSDVAKNIEFNLNLIKSEAIKEFAEELEYFVLNEDIEVVEHKCKDYESYINGANQFRHQIKNGINNLVKDMTETKKALHKINHNSLCETETYNMGGITNE